MSSSSSPCYELIGRIFYFLLDPAEEFLTLFPQVPSRVFPETDDDSFRTHLMFIFDIVFGFFYSMFALEKSADAFGSSPC